jgi:hemoglobin
MPSLYEHAGGDEGLHRLEEVFYNKLLTDPLLKPLFPVRRKNHVRHLMWFTAESFGGPDRFTRELGFAYIVGEHRHLNITDEQRQRFVELYMESLDAAGLPADKAFREDFRSHAEFGAKVAQINSHAETDAELHPLSQVPHWTWDGDD